MPEPISFARWDGGRTEGEKVSGMNGKCPVYSSIGVATVVLRRVCLLFLWFQGSSLTLCLPVVAAVVKSFDCIPGFVFIGVTWIVVCERYKSTGNHGEG